MGPFTMGPIPEVTMPCGPLAGPDGESPSVRTHKQDWKPLGVSRSGDPLSVACAPSSSKGEGLRWFPSHPFPTPNHTPPSSPAHWGSCFSSDSTALPTIVPRAGTSSLQAPLCGCLGRSAWQLRV